MAETHGKPTVITDAGPSPSQQMRSRQIRYAVMMGIRALFLVVAAILVMLEAPLMWLWLGVCAAGMVLLPWMAVIIANDRSPRADRKLFRRQKDGDDTPVEIEAPKPPRVIDVDTADGSGS